jgi:hypothetical protein
MTEPIKENTPPQPTEMDLPLPGTLSALPAAESVAEGASPAHVPQDPQSSYDPQSSHYPPPETPLIPHRSLGVSTGRPHQP